MPADTADPALFLDGAWQLGEGRDTRPVVNPATGSAIAEVPVATAADLDAALAAAEKAFALWRATDVNARSTSGVCWSTPRLYTASNVPSAKGSR